MGQYLEGTERQWSRSYSAAVVTEAGRVVWMAGQTAVVDADGADIAGNFEAGPRAVEAWSGPARDQTDRSGQPPDTHMR